jgi:RNA polymerase sigma-70 factor (ECF subfamily)
LDADAEKNLVASCRTGDRAAYANLVRTHCGRVFAICFGVLGNRHDAEDAAQQTFLRGLMHVRSLRHNDRFGPWIAQIARNQCLDVIRRRKHPASPPTDPGDERIDPDDCRRLEAALSRLSEDYRVPLLLFYFDGRSTASIAETLGVSQATIQTRLSRARKQLRDLLAAEGDEP